MKGMFSASYRDCASAECQGAGAAGGDELKPLWEQQDKNRTYA